MPRRIDAGEVLAALGGLLVLVSLFLDWFSLDGDAELFDDAGASGWTAFESLDLVLAGLAIAAIATGARAFGTVGSLGPRALLPLGALLTLIVVTQIVEPPPVVAEFDPSTGAWLALAGALLVLAGGILRVARFDVTVSVGAKDVRPRVPAVDRREQAAVTDDDGSASGRASGSGDLQGAVQRRSLLDDDPAAQDPEATQPFRPVDPSP